MAELVCPKCGETFKGPLIEKKRIGIGFTFFHGIVACPKCGYEGPHMEFKK